MYTILVVDDEKDIVSALEIYLKAEGYRVLSACNGKEALAAAAREDVHLILMDIMMPVMDGLSAMAQLRQTSNVPVILLTAKGEDTDKVLGLNVGADDYITKPFSPSVLCAKVKACLRRMSLSAPSSSGVLSAGPFCYFSDEMRLLKKGIEVPLSSKESFLMKYFLTNQNKVLTKEQIYRSIWGDNVVDDNTIMVHIRRLRTKIEDDPNKPLYLRTIRGVGYQFVAE